MRSSKEFKERQLGASPISPSTTVDWCAVTVPIFVNSQMHTNGKSTRNHGAAGNDSAANRIAANSYGLPASKGSG